MRASGRQFQVVQAVVGLARGSLRQRLNCSTAQRRVRISDNPVVLFSDETPSGVPVNFLTLDVEISMPLSRRGMLIMSHIPTVGGCACATAEAVLHLNRRRWLTAKEYVFGSSEEVLRRVCEGMPLDIRSRQLGGLRLQSIEDINAAIERSLHCGRH